MELRSSSVDFDEVFLISGGGRVCACFSSLCLESSNFIFMYDRPKPLKRAKPPMRRSLMPLLSSMLAGKLVRNREEGSHVYRES